MTVVFSACRLSTAVGYLVSGHSSQLLHRGPVDDRKMESSLFYWQDFLAFFAVPLVEAFRSCCFVCVCVCRCADFCSVE